MTILLLSFYKHVFSFLQNCGVFICVIEGSAPDQLQEAFELRYYTIGRAGWVSLIGHSQMVKCPNPIPKLTSKKDKIHSNRKTTE